MKAIFLSDAHLKRQNDTNYRELLRFLESLNPVDRTPSLPDEPESPEGVQPGGLRIDHLFILGDFFDFWFARGEAVYPEYRPVIASLKDLKNRGAMIHLTEGNHDFFLEDYFAKGLGFDVTPDWGEWRDGDGRILFSHGDTVDRGNRKYLLLRRVLRSGFVFHLQRILPLSLLWRIARSFSGMSKGWSRQRAEVLAEKMHRFMGGKLAEGYDVVVLGHAHHPGIREWVKPQGVGTSVTLGDWIEDFSYLYYADGRVKLRSQKG